MDNRRLFLAALLSLVVLILWQWVFPPPPPVEPAVPLAAPGTEAPDTTEQARPAEVETTPASGAESAATPVESLAQGVTEAGGQAPRPLRVADREQRAVLATERFDATFTNRGGVLESFVLHDPEAGGGEVELVRVRDRDQAYPFALMSTAADRLAVDRELWVVASATTSSVRYTYSGPLGSAEKEFAVDGDVIRVSVDYEGGPQWSVLLGPGIRNPRYSELGDRFQKRFRQVTVGSAEAVEGQPASKVAAMSELPLQAGSWLALEDKYFLLAFAPRTSLAAAVAVPAVIAAGPDGEIAGYELRPDFDAEQEEADDESTRDLAVLLQPAGDRLEGTALLGAKEFFELRSLARTGSFPSGIERTIRWGWLGFLAKPLLFGLRWIHQSVVHNYGWSIVLMTFLIKIVLFPLTHKSYISMQRMQKLNPRIEAIRQRFRPKLRDKQGRPNLEMQRKMNEEMQSLFREEGVSPAGGCLPILVQMPIFFAFYQLLIHAVELYGQPWVGWVHDLTLKDPYYVLPLVMGATQLASSKFMAAPTNPSQRIIMNTMPIWFTIFALGFPSGLVLYWLTNNVLTIVQHAGYNRLKKAGFFKGNAEEAPATSGK